MAHHFIFADKDTIDVSLIITGDIGTTDQKYIQDNVARVRKDAIAFLSPQKASVVNNAGSEVTSIVANRNALSGTSYSFAPYQLSIIWLWLWPEPNLVLIGTTNDPGHFDNTEIISDMALFGTNISLFAITK